MPKKSFFLFTLFLFFLPLFSLAGGCLDKSCSGNSNCGCERYRVDPGETITVFEHNLCQRITNQSGSPPTFIPTRTQTEWNLFCSFKPSHITCVPCCTNECSYSGQTEYQCSGNWIQRRTCGNYDPDPCLEWSSWENYENCDTRDTCQHGIYYDYSCSPAGYCRESRYCTSTCCDKIDGCNAGYYYDCYCVGDSCTCSKSCREQCCDEYYGNPNAYCAGDICFPPSSSTPPPSTPPPSTPPPSTPPPAPPSGCYGSIDCWNCGESLPCIRVVFSFNNCPDTVYLYRDGSLVRTLWSGQGTGNYYDRDVAYGRSYFYSLISGGQTLSSRSCSPSGSGTPPPSTPPPSNPSPTPGPTCSASLSCQSSTENSITLSYSFSNCGTISLYRGSSYLTSLGSGTKSGTYTDSGLSPGSTYTYYLKEGNTTRAQISCSTRQSSCVRGTPIVTISPYTFDGAPGVTFNFSVYVTNHDSAGCPSTVMEITGSWAGSSQWVGTTQMTYPMPPGQTYQFTGWNITPTSSVLPGSYEHTVTAKNRDSGATGAYKLFYIVRSLSCYKSYPNPNPAATYTSFIAEGFAIKRCSVKVWDLTSYLQWEGSADTSDHTRCSIYWNLKNRFGQNLGNGSYIYRMTVYDINNKSQDCAQGFVVIER